MGNTVRQDALAAAVMEEKATTTSDDDDFESWVDYREAKETLTEKERDGSNGGR